MGDHPNAQLIRRGYEAFSAGDMATIDATFADDIKWHNSGTGPLSGTFEGKEAVFGFFAKFAELTEGNARLDVHDVVANDEHAVALINSHLERKGQSLDSKSVHVWHVRDGKAQEFWGYDEDPAALDALLSS